MVNTQLMGLPMYKYIMTEYKILGASLTLCKHYTTAVSFSFLVTGLREDTQELQDEKEVGLGSQLTPVLY